MQYQMRLPREVVGSLPLAVFKTQLDKAMSDLMQCWCSSCLSWRKDLMTSKIPFKLLLL